jgi:hypothetical protein
MMASNLTVKAGSRSLNGFRGIQAFSGSQVGQRDLALSRGRGAKWGEARLAGQECSVITNVRRRGAARRRLQRSAEAAHAAAASPGPRGTTTWAAMLPWALVDQHVCTRVLVLRPLPLQVAPRASVQRRTPAPQQQSAAAAAAPARVPHRAAPAPRRAPRVVAQAANAASAASAEIARRSPKDVRVVVAGPTGYIGKFVAKELISRGFQVGRGLARHGRTPVGHEAGVTPQAVATC